MDQEGNSDITAPTAKRSRKRAVSRACQPCNQLKKRCDINRPCQVSISPVYSADSGLPGTFQGLFHGLQRCISRGISDQCKDRTTKAEERWQIRKQRVLSAARSGIWSPDSSEVLIEHLTHQHAAVEVNNLADTGISRRKTSVASTTTSACAAESEKSATSRLTQLTHQTRSSASTSATVQVSSACTISSGGPSHEDFEREVLQ